jgi:hypothetical protein
LRQHFVELRARRLSACELLKEELVNFGGRQGIKLRIWILVIRRNTPVPNALISHAQERNTNGLCIT